MHGTGDINGAELNSFAHNSAARDEVLRFRDEAYPDDNTTTLDATTTVVALVHTAKTTSAPQIAALGLYTQKASSATVAHAARYLDHFRAEPEWLNRVVSGPVTTIKECEH